VFETSADLVASSALNILHLHGYNRSDQLLSASGMTPESSVLLDQGYAGLVSGSFVVVTSPVQNPIPIQLLAVTDEGTQRKIWWKPGDLPANLNLPVADVVILGKPKQTMQLADSARADEIAAGQSSVSVDDPYIFATFWITGPVANGTFFDPVVFVSSGFQQAAQLLTLNSSAISWAPSFNLALRRSETRVYEGVWSGNFFSPVAPGDQSLQISGVNVGDTIILWDSTNVAVVRIASVQSGTCGLAQPVSQAFPNGGLSFNVSLPDPGTGSDGGPFTTVAAVLLPPSTDTLVLDKSYQGLLEGQQVVITDGDTTLVRTLSSVAIDSSQRTVLTISQPLGQPLKVATTNVYGPFELQMRVDGYNRSTASLPAGATQITLDGVIAGLVPGRLLILEDSNGAEAVRITTIAVNDGNTDVDLEAGTSTAHVLSDTSVLGNVVQVTHGESVGENPLGSGDQSQANQQFSLHQKPTTYVHDPQGDRGASDTLQVFVGDELWTEVPSLAESGPNDHHIMAEIDENQAMSFTGGDGRHGAKFPTGRNNISAQYRTGMGTAGNLAANAIGVLPAPLPFVLSSRNPVASAGGADPDTPESTRQLAQFTVRTLDRAVSVQDFQDLALTYSGIDKASATFSRVDGRSRIVLVVATSGGEPLPDPLRSSLRAFIADRSVPNQNVLIRDYKPYPVRLGLEVHVRSNFLRVPTGVLVQEALGSGTTPDGKEGYFNFNQRGLGESLYLSDVYDLVQELEGVEFLVVTEFRGETNAASSGVARDVIRVPADSVATGGDPLDPSVGILSVKLMGGIA